MAGSPRARNRRTPRLQAPLLLPPEEGEKKVADALHFAPLRSGPEDSAVPVLSSPSSGGSKRGAPPPCCQPAKAQSSILVLPAVLGLGVGDGADHVDDAVVAQPLELLDR